METNKFFVLVDEKDLEAAAAAAAAVHSSIGFAFQHLSAGLSLRLTGLDSLDQSRDVELGWVRQSVVGS